MGQRVRTVTCIIYRRRERDADPRQNEIFYQVWLVVEVCPDEDAAFLPEPMLASLLVTGNVKNVRERLKDAWSESLADRVEDVVWKSADDLSQQQIAELVANLPDSIKALVETPVEDLATSAGASLPMAAFGGDVAATLALRPVLEPVEKAVHGLEVVGIVIGLMTGAHALAVICAKHLAHDEIGSVLATGFKQLVKTPGVRELDSSRDPVDDLAAESAGHAEGGSRPITPGEALGKFSERAAAIRAAATRDTRSVRARDPLGPLD